LLACEHRFVLSPRGIEPEAHSYDERNRKNSDDRWRKPALDAQRRRNYLWDIDQALMKSG
jgi:hypothetical protein